MNLHNVRQAVSALRNLVNDERRRDRAACYLIFSIFDVLGNELSLQRDEVQMTLPNQKDNYGLPCDEINETTLKVASRFLAIADRYLAVYINGENVTGRKVRAIFVNHNDRDNFSFIGTVVEGFDNLIVLRDVDGARSDGRTTEVINLASETFIRLELLPNDPPKPT